MFHNLLQKLFLNFFFIIHFVLQSFNHFNNQGIIPRSYAFINCLKELGAVYK